MKILISGASGLIGSYISERYIEIGHEVIALQETPKSFAIRQHLATLLNLITNRINYRIQSTI